MGGEQEQSKPTISLPPVPMSNFVDVFLKSTIKNFLNYRDCNLSKTPFTTIRSSVSNLRFCNILFFMWVVGMVTQEAQE
jgi:hypothetical protein